MDRQGLLCGQPSRALWTTTEEDLREGKQVYFQHADGSWEGDLRPDQTGLPQALNLEPLRQEIHKKARRPNDLAGKVERRRGALGSKSVFAGTRIPVDTVLRYLEHGKTTAEILRAFPDLTEQDIEVAKSESVA